MSAIAVTKLQKAFQTKRKAAGLGGSLRALMRPEYATVEAVRGLSFEMEAGELLGFIGPNGAGKSTTIKMLTGILYPSGGETKMLGFTPWKERQKLAFRIGTAKLLRFTLVPAALMGAVPAEFTRAFTWGALAQRLVGAADFLAVAIWTFETGLRRYESGSAIQVEV